MKQEEFNTLVKFLEEGVQYEIDFCNNPKESYQMFSTKLIRDFERLAQTMVVKPVDCEEDYNDIPATGLFFEILGISSKCSGNEAEIADRVTKLFVKHSLEVIAFALEWLKKNATKYSGLANKIVVTPLGYEESRTIAVLNMKLYDDFKKQITEELCRKYS